MPGTVFALLVGIDEYLDPELNRLRGAAADMRAMSEFLHARVPDEPQELILLNADATRQGVIDGFRQHLGRARNGDVALFCYSGHGSEQPVPEEFRTIEFDGKNQTLVCHDSRTGGVPDLADKEVSQLLDEIAARGVHVVAVLDCCHSTGGTREPLVNIRSAPAATDRPQEFLSGAREATATPSSPAHVALSACQRFELAAEQPVDRKVRGVFSAALLTALGTLPSGATYRELLTAAKCRVENLSGAQVPGLYPLEAGGPADQPFLGGAVVRPAAGFTLRQVDVQWEVDGGRCHGFPEPTPDDPLLLRTTAAADPPGQLVRATAVLAGRTQVEPLDWTPVTGQEYPVLLDSAPLPPAGVVLGGLPEDDADALRLVREVIDRAGPGGEPSLHLRVVPAETSGTGLRLRVAAPVANGARSYRILRGDGTPATADIAGHTTDGARLVVARLEHIARWTHLKNIDNPGSALAGGVALEVLAAEPGQATAAPDGGTPLLADEHGDIRLSYRTVGSELKPPAVFLRLRNTTDRRLWCAMLDLTDRFRVHPRLLTGEWIGPNDVGFAYGGRPIPVSLPANRPVRPGARVQDWIKLVVSDDQFSSLAFELDPLDEPASRSTRGRVRPLSVVDRLGLRASTRDLGDEDPPPDRTADWATSMVSIITSVP